VRKQAPVSREKIALGILMFVLLTVGGYAAVRWSAGAESESVFAALSDATTGLLILAALLALTDMALGGARFWVVARELKPGFRWWDGLHVFLYLIFAAGVTPMQLGGGPAQYFILRRKGLHAHDTLAVLSVNWVSGLIALVTLAGAGLWYLILDGNVALGGLLRGLIAMVGIAVLAAIAVTLFPRQITRVLVSIRSFRRSRGGRKILRAGARYRGAIREFKQTGSGRRAWLINVALGFLALLARCLVGVAVLAALGVNADAFSVIGRQALQFAVIVVAPSPGGSGVAEVTTIGLMTGVVPGALILSYTVLWRFFTAYIGIAVGAVRVAVDLFKSATPNVSSTSSDSPH
jgi:uncharacterized protein (TIRG00374 family)